VAGQFEVTPRGMRFIDIEALAGTSQMRVDGEMLFKGSADLAFNCTPVNLGEISPVGTVRLSGTGPARGRIHGDFDQLVIEGDLELDGVKVAGFDFGRGK